MPTCSTTAPARTSGRSRGRQIRAQNVSSQRTETCVARSSSRGCQASQVMSIDWYSRLANARHIASPFHHASPWSFEMPGEEVDDAHVDVDQPQRQVRAGARRRTAGRRPAAPHRQPSVDRERLPARSDRQVQRQHRVDLVEAERRRRDPVRVRDRDQERQDRRDAGPQPEGEHRQHDHGERRTPATSIRRGPATRTSRHSCRPEQRPHETLAQPGGGAEEVGQHQPPDGVGIQEHQAGQDADQPEQRRVGRA